MPISAKTQHAGATPERQLAAFIAKFSPAHQAVLRASRRALRRRLPTAHELVYDNYNFFVIGYSATLRPSDCIVSLVGGSNGAGLSFYRGATLPDPTGILLGSGSQNRFIRLPTADVLATPAVDALIEAAIAQAPTHLPSAGRGTLVIRSVSEKQRPRKRG